jgi:hypothetical protein
LKYIKEGGDFQIFFNQNGREKHQGLTNFKILDKSKGEEHHYTRETARKQIWEL